MYSELALALVFGVAFWCGSATPKQDQKAKLYRMEGVIGLGI
jgi:hypothetical protein